MSTAVKTLIPTIDRLNQLSSESPLVMLAAPIFELLIKLQGGIISPSSDLRKNFDQLIKELEASALKIGFRDTQIQHTKFALAAFIDETVLTANFPLREEWEKYPLQLEYFGEHLAGIKYFERLDSLIKAGEDEIDIVEIYYLCMIFGYKGRFKIYLEDQLLLLIKEVGEHLKRYNRLLESSLSPHWRVNDQPVVSEEIGIPLWVKFTLFGVCSFSLFLYIIFKYLLNNQLESAINQLLR